MKKEDFKVSVIGKGGAVKSLAWGDDYKEWPIEKRLEYAEALAAAMNDAADRIQQERDKLLEENILIKNLNANAQKFADISRESLVKNITESNQLNQDYIREIAELKVRINAQEKVIEQLNGK